MLTPSKPLFCVVLALALAGCSQRTAPPAAGPPDVTVGEVLVRNVPQLLTCVGQTEATANVDVRARVEGFIAKVHFVEGTFVKEGDQLFTIDKEPIEQRLNQAKAEQARVKAALDNAEINVHRQKELYEKQAVSKKDYDDAVARRDQALGSFESAAAQVRSAEIDLGYCDVKAPVAGLIGAKQVDAGALVGRGEPTLMATISPLDPMWVDFSLSSAQVLDARRTIGERARDSVFSLELPDGTDFDELGKLTFIDRTVDPRTGTLRMRAEFPNPKNWLRPGMFARVRVLMQTRTNAVLAPIRSVQEIQGTYSVYVVDAENKARFRRVKPGQRVGSLWLIEEGLSAGEKIIVDGAFKARNDQPVAPTPVTISDEPLLELAKSVPSPRPAEKAMEN